MSSSTISSLLFTAALLAVTAGFAAAQSSDCASKLLPCAEYINSTSPPNTCCDSIKEVVTTQLPCLCNLYQSPDLLKSLGINETQALELPKNCGLPVDTNACKALAPGSSPATPSGSPPGSQDKNGAERRISWMGIPALVLVSAISFLY